MPAALLDAPARTCPECSEPVTRPRATYCSRRCLGRVTSRAQRARGYLNTYRTTVPCTWCGKAIRRDPRAAAAGKQPHCDNLCAAASRAVITSCEVPPGHPSRTTPVPPEHPSRQRQRHPSAFVAGRCQECGDAFVAHREAHRGDGHDVQLLFCSLDCRLRLKRRRRRARRCGSAGTFTREQLLAVFTIGGRRCAYCDVVVLGTPDADHVQALARGGSNDLSNVLPACRACNADKRELSLGEWANDRAARGLPPVRTVLDTEDKRFAHLVLGPEVAAA